MHKMQKVGFIVFPSVFILVGLICLIAGFMAENSILKIMGAVWLPLGVLNLLFIIVALKKEK